jgi:predicted enzyme related to lactoylglutathione lyase
MAIGARLHRRSEYRARVTARLILTAALLAACTPQPRPPAAPCPVTAPPVAAAPGTGLQYVGGTAIRAKDPKALAAWYTETFGMVIKGEMPGGLYGGFEWNDQSFNIAIVAATGDHPGAAPGTAYLVFRVGDYDGYLAARAAKGLVPFTTTGDAKYGRFASFHDPEGNEVDVWGK